MAISTQIQNLNLIPGKSAPVVVHLSQGNVGNTVQFYLYDGDNPYYPTNVSIAVHGVRADNTVFGPYAVSVTSGSNLVSFDIVTAMTSVNGAAIGELVITDNNQNQIGSANFGMLVEETPYSSSVTYEDDLSIYQRILAYVQSFPASISGQVAAEAEIRKSETESLQSQLNSETSDIRSSISTTKTDIQALISAEASSRATTDTSLQGQINQIVAPSGEAPSAAEIQNARVGADNVTYSTLGDAIRAQVSELNTYTKYPKYAGLKGLKNLAYHTIPSTEYTFGNGYNRDVHIGDVLSTYPTATGYYSHTVISCTEYEVLCISYRQLEPYAHVMYCDAGMKVIGIDRDTVASESKVITDKLIVAPAGCSFVVVYSQSQAQPNSGGLNVFKRVTGIYYGESNYIDTLVNAPGLRDGAVSNPSRYDAVAVSNIIPINGALSARLFCTKSIPTGHHIEYRYTTFDVATGVSNISDDHKVRADQILNAGSDGTVNIRFIDGEKGFAFAIRELDDSDTSYPLRYGDIAKNEVFYLLNHFDEAFMPNGYIIDAALHKTKVRVETVRNTLILGLQAFCKYSGNWYSVYEGHLYKQNEAFEQVSDTAVSIGHANSLQLGNSNLAYVSGWNDNKIYVVNLDTLAVTRTISLPTTGYTTGVVDEGRNLAYIFRADDASTLGPWDFIVYNLSTNSIVTQTKTIPFANIQGVDFFNDRIIMANGLATEASPNGIHVFNTSGECLADYYLTYPPYEFEGVFVDRENHDLYLNDTTQNLFVVKG